MPWLLALVCFGRRNEAVCSRCYCCSCSHMLLFKYTILMSNDLFVNTRNSLPKTETRELRLKTCDVINDAIIPVKAGAAALLNYAYMVLF